MRVGAIQSCYIPWRGFFDFIASVDLFVLYDDVQYSRGSWRNRNQLKFAEGLRWITVPVRFAFGATVDQVLIGRLNRGDWRREHQRLIEASLGSAPYFNDAFAIWRDATETIPALLSDLNERLIRAICAYLRISTRIERSTQYSVEGTSTDRLLALLRKIGADAYLSGPAATAYLDEARFRESGIRLEYKRYDYRPYPQLWGGFEGAVTVLDLIANCGPAAREWLASAAPNDVAVA